MSVKVKLHRPMIGLIRFTLFQRIVLLIRGRLYFVTRKPMEITWSIRTPQELRAEAAKAE